MKLNKHAWVLWGIALIAVIAMMLLIPFAHTAVWWIALCGTVLMFCLCAYAFTMAFRKGETLESKVLGWPIFKVGYTALIAQILIGFALMALSAFCPAWVAALIEVAVFGVTAFCLTVKDAARVVVSQSEAAVKDNTAAWKAIRAKASALAGSTGNPEMKKLADAIRYADPTPTSMDAEIAGALDKISESPDEESIRRANALMEQRKALAKEEK